MILLRVLGELTCEEVGKVIGKRTGAVKALQRRGYEALETELAKERVTI